MIYFKLVYNVHVYNTINQFVTNLLLNGSNIMDLGIKINFRIIYFKLNHNVHVYNTINQFI